MPSSTVCAVCLVAKAIEKYGIEIEPTNKRFRESITSLKLKRHDEAVNVLWFNYPIDSGMTTGCVSCEDVVDKLCDKKLVV
jgi:hypothetical protein